MQNYTTVRDVVDTDLLEEYLDQCRQAKSHELERGRSSFLKWWDVLWKVSLQYESIVNEALCVNELRMKALRMLSMKALGQINKLSLQFCKANCKSSRINAKLRAKLGQFARMRKL